MLKPLSLTLHQFKTIPHLEFAFPTEPGLYFVTGKNSVNSRLEGNACGKSTLFCDGVSWCLYGKTPRGLRANDVVSWSSSSCFVEFQFLIGMNHYHIKRQQNPNSLTCSINKERFAVVTQEDLNRIIGVDYEAFCFSVIFAQFGKMFFDLGPTDKTNLMESVLPLQVWEDAIQLTKKRVADLEKSVTQLVNKQMEIGGRLSVIDDLITQSDVKLAEWDTDKQNEIERIQSTMAQFDEQLKAQKEKGRTLRQKELAVTESLTEATAIIDEMVAAHNDLMLSMNSLNSRSSRLSEEAAGIQQEIRRLSKLGDVCVTCKQKIEGQHIHSETERHNQRLLDIEQSLTQVKAEAIALQKSIKSSASEVSEAKKVAEDIQRDLNAVGGELSGIKHTILGITHNKNNAINSLESIQKRKNPFLSQKEQLQKEQDELKQKEGKLNRHLAEKQQSILNTQYWVTGFKDIKLMVIHEVLAQLEIEVNNNLYQLGLPEWRIEFASEVVNKSGKTKNSFTVLIHSPETDKPVAWESWSGGETQRLRIAGALGVADLITSCFGALQGFEVFDEPSQFLSASGISDVVESLRDRALNTGKVIFLIDHRNLDATKFSGLYTVVRHSNNVQILLQQ